MKVKALVEPAVNGEMKYHFSCVKNFSPGSNQSKFRNSSTPKVLKGKRGEVEIEVTRERNPKFGAQLIKKKQTRALITNNL